ncbi:MAG TPA: putative sporulation protein YtxC [Bacilli bacterium]|nr:putative sporulation protein YtxC [Bacilli bacterium]
MKKWTIGVEKEAQALCDRLEGARDRLAEQDVRLVGEQTRRGKYTFFTYRLVGSSYGVKHATWKAAILGLSEAVATFITEVWERLELQRMLTQDFYYYAAEEVDYLAEAAVKILADLKDEHGRPFRFGHIVEQVAEQLTAGQELVIEGMLRFRMQPLHEDLHRVVEQAIDEYLMEMEYQEFVKLLRYFLDVQEPGLPMLHVVAVHEEEIRLFDGEGRPLTAELCDGRLSAELTDGQVAAEDLLSVLVALAPERLLVHPVGRQEEAPPFVETLTKIFREKAKVCAGCPLCESEEAWKQPPSVSEWNM